MQFLVATLFLNVWIYKILTSHLIVGILIIIASFLLFMVLRYKKHQNLFLFLICSFLLNGFLQLKLTDRVSLTSLTSLEKDRVQQRLHAYPPLNIPLAHWIEGRRESIAIRRISRNFSNLVSINYYFFSNHPRENTSPGEFEKFPYIFLPFFFVGLYSLIKKKEYPYLFLFVIGLVLLTFWGIGETGPFILFPFFVIAITLGLEKIFLSLRSKTHKVILSLAVILICIQTVSYALY